MKQKIQTLAVGFAIILAAAIQTEFNQHVKLKLKAHHAMGLKLKSSSAEKSAEQLN